MWNEIVLMLHPSFGILGVLAALWVFVEVINISDGNFQRIRQASLVVPVLIWLSYLVGGYWYVKFYGADKAIIKAGPWPAAHTLFMETKEHVFLAMLLLSTYLPIAVFNNDLRTSAGARTLVLWIAALVVLLGLAMEGAGAVTALGVKMGLVGR